MSRTPAYLKAAIEGEDAAVDRYHQFAEVADAEDLPNIAYLFRTLAAAEDIHLKNHQRALGEEFIPVATSLTCGTTAQNLAEAIAGETQESTVTYPEMLKNLRKEQKTEQGKLAALSVQWARKVEQHHVTLLKQALAAVEACQDFPFDSLWICTVCGRIFLPNQVPNTCPVCGHDKMFYTLLER